LISGETRDHHLAPFSIKEIRDAIPSHCFERSALRSSSYIVYDVAAISLCLCAGYYFDTHISNNVHWIVSFLFWNMVWFAQGAFMTGIWVIAHECGHQAFSSSRTINNTVGWVLHSALLVPYHSWRITHGIHHKSTSHMSKDQVYVPKTHSQVTGVTSISDTVAHDTIADTPLVAFFQIVLLLTLGWPFYLVTNAWSQNHGRRANHFEPSSPMFKPSHRMDIIVSNIGLLIVASGLGWFSYSYSLASMIKFYFAPYLWVNFWLVLYTYLQHTDLRVPHFRGEEWNFIRGAIGTVDRDYGIFNHIHHHIGDTHVAHHLFSQMPHYHAEEATAAVKKVLGKYYLYDNTPIMSALWKNWNTCHFVDDEADIVYYQTLSPKKAQ